MTAKRLIRSTTVLSVRRNGSVVLAGDGQVTLGRIGDQTSGEEDPAALQRQDRGRVRGIDCRRLHFVQPLRGKLEEYHGNLGGARWNWPRTGVLTSSCVIWRPCCWSAKGADVSAQRPGRCDRTGRRIAAIGSGGPYAQAAAQALAEHTELHGAADCRRSHEDCGQDVHLYQRQGND